MDQTPDMRAYRLLQRTIMLCAALAVTLEVLFMLYALDTSARRCNQVQDVRSYILGATERAQASLPTLAYYKAHPDELRVQLDALEAQRREFAKPLRCSFL